MGNYLLVIAGVLLSFNLFSISIKSNTANRTIINTPKSIFESSIAYYSLSESTCIQFNSNDLKTKLTSYYDESFQKMNIRYVMVINTYDQENNNFPKFGKANGVKVTVTAKCGEFCRIKRTINYEIRPGNYGNI